MKVLNLIEKGYDVFLVSSSLYFMVDSKIPEIILNKHGIPEDYSITCGLIEMFTGACLGILAYERIYNRILKRDGTIRDGKQEITDKVKN